eukprot:6198606-Pleurochrysis_carterae.AAC.3
MQTAHRYAQTSNHTCRSTAHTKSLDRDLLCHEELAKAQACTGKLCLEGLCYATPSWPCVSQLALSVCTLDGFRREPTTHAQAARRHESIEMLRSQKEADA